jgi:hypothetical protein
VTEGPVFEDTEVRVCFVRREAEFEAGVFVDLAADAWRGSSSRACDLPGSNESRQYATGGGEGFLHAWSAVSAGVFPDMKRSVWRSGILCDLRISDCVDDAAALGFRGCGECA